jgi:pimeloyl-ACP methyl ester carboxylesterase
MRCKFDTVAGIKTRYLYEGSGPTLLMVHGVGASGDMWFHNVDYCAEKFAVIAPDIVCHGFTAAVDFKGRTPQQAAVEHLNALMDHVGAKKYAVVGSSYGALLASLMYFTSPDRIDKLILVGSGSTFHPPEEQVKTLQGARANGSKAMENPTWEVCRQRLGNICYDPKTVVEEMLLPQMTSYAMPDRLPAYLATIEGMIKSVDSKEWRVYHRLDQIKAKTLIITGREDIRSSWELTVAGHKKMPNAQLKIYEKCGHLPMSEHADRFNRDMMEFLCR